KGRPLLPEGGGVVVGESGRKREEAETKAGFIGSWKSNARRPALFLRKQLRWQTEPGARPLQVCTRGNNGPSVNYFSRTRYLVLFLTPSPSVRFDHETVLDSARYRPGRRGDGERPSIRRCR